MYKLLILYSAILVTACGQKGEDLSSNKKEDSILYYPYSPVYTASFEKGQDSNGKKVLEIWKQFETGNIMNTTENFSDSITMIFPDIRLHGQKDSILTLFKKRRDVYADVQCYIDSWMPLYAKDAKENIVVVWGRQDCTMQNGTRDYLVLHEIWKFDKAGKIKQMVQYITHPH